MFKYNTNSNFEEKFNVNSHLLGFFLSLIAFVLLILKGFESSSLLNTFSYCTFSISMMFLYYSSANYHNASDKKKRAQLKIVDHCAIYVLIAGTYTPFALISIVDTKGWVFAAIGITVKLFFTGRFKVISTLMYVVMGWLILLFVKSFMEALSAEGIYWLVIGGLLYTVGALIYLVKKIPLNHGIFHVFVLA